MLLIQCSVCLQWLNHCWSKSAAYDNMKVKIMVHCITQMQQYYYWVVCLKLNVQYLSQALIITVIVTSTEHIDGLEYDNGTSISIVNSLAPGRFQWIFRQVIFKLILWLMAEVSLVKLLSVECHWISLIMSHPALIQVMAWCHQATSHYLSQCWPRSVRSHMPYGVSRPQWFNGWTHWRYQSIPQSCR